MKKKLSFAITIFLFLHGTCIFAQSLYAVSEDEKIRQSSIIIEGKVTEQQCFWNTAHTMIYTSNKVEVYKVFKGTVASNYVEIMTVGGTVGEDNITASDLLELSAGETGVFFCYPNSIDLRSPQSQAVLFDIWSSSQGVYKYDLSNQSASAPFVRLANITRDIYNNLQLKTGRNFENKKPTFNIADFIPSHHSPTAVSITSFSPTSIIAGAYSIPAENTLTITGSGFGAAGGVTAGINFDNPDNGTGGTPLFVLSTSDLIISWSDLSIVVKVPAKVGTGTFSVVNASAESGISPTALDVKYAILNGTFGASPINRQYSLMIKNGIGGYDYLYCTSTANMGVDFSTAAQEPSFSRAITTWKEIAGLNFVYAGTTTTQTVSAGDGINIIMMDNTGTGNPVLASGVLAVCYSSGLSCTGNSYVQRTGFDIVVRNSGVSSGSTVFNNGPCKTSTSITEYDMETVMLHELGHALNLGHINDTYIGTWPDVDPGKLMNSSIVNGVDRRSPDWSAYTGALYNILPRGLVYGGCLSPETEMTALATTTESKDECPGSFPSVATPFGTAVAFDLNHATSNKTKDPQFTAVNTTSVGVGITNNAFYAIKTAASGGGSLVITVSGYSTTPVSQAACPDMGVELSLYLASSCPTAQAYPTPLAYRTFSGSGALSAITGLATSTNYLVMVDGISNTRANFTLTFGGSALPVKLLSFTGKKWGLTVLLNWQTASEYDNDRFEIETSKDGINYYKIGSVKSKGNSSITQSYSFTDFLPVKGVNYYRLCQVDLNGDQNYSRIVNLQFDENAGTVILYPNPTKDKLTVALSQPSAKTDIRIFGNDGRLVLSLSALTIQRLYEIDIKKLSGGFYIAEITTVRGKVIQKFIKD